MFIPTLPQDPINNSDGHLTSAWNNLFTTLIQNMQQALSNEGFVIPSVSSANNSVTPPVSGGQLAVIAASFGQANGALVGTLVFDPNVVNGGSSPPLNGQLKVLLADGVFHPVTNT